jgi:hypothetical protein
MESVMFIVIVLVSLSALYIHDQGIDLYSSVRPHYNSFMGRMGAIMSLPKQWVYDNKYVKAYKKAIVAVNNENEYIANKKISDKMESYLRNNDACRFCLGSPHSFRIFAYEYQLHNVRQALRAKFGEWSDKVDSADCSDNETVQIEYKGKKTYDGYKITIVIDYDLNDLPDGLLKPGCEVIREEEIVYSCRIECAV